MAVMLEDVKVELMVVKMGGWWVGTKVGERVDLTETMTVVQSGHHSVDWKVENLVDN